MDYRDAINHILALITEESLLRRIYKFIERVYAGNRK